MTDSAFTPVTGTYRPALPAARATHQPAAAPLARELTCRVVTEAAELEALRPAWLDLLSRSRGNELMLSPDWLLTWWRIFGPQEGRRLRTVLLSRGDRLVGLAPLLLRRHWHRRVLPFRRVELLGSGERDRDSICSDYLNVIAERGQEAAVAAALPRALAASRIGPWDELVFTMMDGEDPFPVLLVDAFRGEGLSAGSEVTGAAPYIPLPATWGGYLKALPGRHRGYLTKALREFHSWAGDDLKVQRATSAEGLEEGKRVLTELHHQRWEGEGRAKEQGGVFRSPHFLAFHNTTMQLFLARGGLELQWLVVRGQPVAAVYNLHWNNKVYFYQCGRRPDLPPRVRPGIAMLAHSIRCAIEAGRREFDFLAGVSQYKTQLALAARPIVRVAVTQPSLPHFLRRVLERGVDVARVVKHRLTRASAEAP